MQVRIGVIYTNKELELELPEGQDSDALVKEITSTLGNESGVLWLTDRRGRRVGIASSKVAYVEVGPESEGRRVGFSAI